MEYDLGRTKRGQVTIPSDESRQLLGLFHQVDVAKRLHETQSFVSKCERGERRIDVVELRAFCKAMGISFTEFTRRLDRELD